MTRTRNVIAFGLAAVLVAACSRSGLDSAAPPGDPSASAEPAVAEDALVDAEMGSGADIVVTGTRIQGRSLTSHSPVTTFGGSGWIPQVGRDRFTSVDQNGFKVAAEEPVST